MFKKKIILILMLSLIFLFCVLSACAETVSWRCSAGDGFWDVPTNWSVSRVPNAGDEVIINCLPRVVVTIRSSARACGLLNHDTLQVINNGVLVFNTRGLTNNGTIYLNDGALGLSDVRITNNGTIHIANGTLFGSPILNNGSMIWLEGAISGMGRAFTNRGSFLIQGDGNHQLGGLTLINTGTIIHAGGQLQQVTSPPTCHFGGCIVNNGLYDFQEGNIIIIGGGVEERFTNTGTLRKLSKGTGTISDRFNNDSGTVEVLEGTLELSGRVDQLSGNTLTGGTWNVFNQATLDITSESNIEVNNANVSLSGTESSFPNINTLRTNGGSFVLANGRSFTTKAEFTNSGTIRLDAGSQLSVTGNYTKTSKGTFALRLAGLDPSQFGRMLVSGDTTLAGDLAPTITKEYVPMEGDEFVIMTYNTLAEGLFDTCSGCLLDGGLVLNPVYELSQLKLVVNQQSEGK